MFRHTLILRFPFKRGLSIHDSNIKRAFSHSVSPILYTLHFDSDSPMLGHVIRSSLSWCTTVGGKFKNLNPTFPLKLRKRSSGQNFGEKNAGSARKLFGTTIRSWHAIKGQPTAEIFTSLQRRRNSKREIIAPYSLPVTVYLLRWRLVRISVAGSPYLACLTSICSFVIPK